MRVLLIPLALLAAGSAPAPEERRVLLTGFDRIRVDGPFAVHVVEGPPAATVSGDRRAVEGVSVRNQGGVLVVSRNIQTSEGWRGDAALAAVTVAVPRLRSANINGGGKLDIDRIEGQRVELGVNGAGSLSVARLAADQLVTTLTGTGLIRLGGGTARNARFMNYGAGSIDAAGVAVNDLTVHSQSAGDGSFTARFTASLSVLGTGAVRVEGNAACRIAGPGPASCAGKSERR
ncbi:GIN domain-containing protein [Sphingomonas sp. MS122]|uniref:GIN domain-containing protein n=1 Tax=Sphingomonas sp. MS122 TaxID=3412683 RepID=UPI003C2E1C74